MMESKKTSKLRRLRNILQIVFFSFIIIILISILPQMIEIAQELEYVQIIICLSDNSCTLE